MSSKPLAWMLLEHAGRALEARLADRARDRLRERGIGRLQVHVVGDQEEARADRGGARRRVDPVRALVGDALGVLADPLAQPLELALPDVGEALARRPRGGVGVEEDGDLELLPDPRAEPLRVPDAVLHRAVLERDERDHVRRAHPRVLALVLREVEQARGRRRHAERRLDGGVRRPYERHDGAVVVRVHLGAEERDARHVLACCDDLVDDLAPPPFAEIWNAFDELHGAGL